MDTVQALLRQSSERRRTHEREVTWTVTRMNGDEVEMFNGRSSRRRWRWPGKPHSGKIIDRETLTVSGRAFPCIVVEEHYRGVASDRWWLHVDADDVVLFPGRVRWERDGVRIEELARIETSLDE